jgi:glutamate carboxypeptidase
MRQTSPMALPDGFLSDLQMLVELESPSDDVEACRKVMSVASSIGERVTGNRAEIFEEGGRPALWLGSKNPRVVMLAHLDTVWPVGSFTPIWKLEGDKLLGPGVFDMKTGVLQAMYALGADPTLLNQVALVATSDEEIGSFASRKLIERISQLADAVLILEASYGTKVKVGRKGSAMYHITVHGRAAHAGLEPEKGVNATTEIAHLILQLSSFGNGTLGTSVVPTLLSAGSTSNTVPASAELDVDVRSYTMAELERVDGAIRSLLAHNPEANISVAGGINRPPLELASTEKLYKKLEEVAASLGMPEIGGVSVGGVSDGNLAAAAGAQVLDGLGAIGDGAHAAHEHVLISSIPSRITLLTHFLQELCKG